MRVALIGSQVGVIAVGDGCGLTYWSEIAAHIAVNEFICYVEKNLPKEPPPYAPSTIKALLRAAIQSVNQTMLTWKHPKTKAKCNVLDKGGNTTLVVAIVFPFIEDEMTTFKFSTALSASPSNAPTPSSSVSDLRSSSSSVTSDKSADSSKHSHEERSKIQRKGSHAAEAEPLKYGVVFTGMGDSEIYLYKTSEPEKPPKDKKHHQTSASATTLPSHERHQSHASTPQKAESPNHGNEEEGKSESKPKSAKKDKQSVKFGSFFGSLPRHSRKNSPQAESSTSGSSNPKTAEASSSNATEGRKSRSSSGGSATETKSRSNSFSISLGRASARSMVSRSPPTHDSSLEGLSLASGPPSYSKAPIPVEFRTDESSTTNDRSSINRERSSSVSAASSRSAITFSAPPASPSGSSPQKSTQPPHTNVVSTTIQEDPQEDASQSSTNSIASKRSAATTVTSVPPEYENATDFSSPSTPPVEEDSPLTHMARNHSEPVRISPHVMSVPSESSIASSDAASTPLSTTPADNSILEATSTPVVKRSSEPPASISTSTKENDQATTETDKNMLAPPSDVSNMDGNAIKSKRLSRSMPDLATLQAELAAAENPSSSSTSTRPNGNGSPSLRLNMAAIGEANDHAAEPSSPTTEDTVTTPRLPSGVWFKIMGDSGKSPFVPFPGLKDKSIPEPNFIALNPGDAVVACSDGVASSYPDLIQWPEISPELYETKEGLDHAIHELLHSTMTAHRDSKTDPDDVTIGAIKVTSYAKRKKSDTMRVAPIRDQTGHFAPEFASSSYKRDYLADFLCEYPKPKEKKSN